MWFLLKLTWASNPCHNTEESFRISIELLKEYFKTADCMSTIKKIEHANTIKIVGKGIQDLRPLEHAKKIRVLLLAGNNISDLRPLSKLRIRWLDISRNPISNIRPLGEINTLETLWASSLMVEDVSGLDELKKIRYLSLEDNKIVNVEPLSSLKKVEFLGLSKNKIDDFRVLKKLNKVKFLSLKDNPIQYCPEKVSWTQLCIQERDN